MGEIKIRGNVISSEEAKSCNDGRKERKVFQIAVKGIHSSAAQKFVLGDQSRSYRKEGWK